MTFIIKILLHIPFGLGWLGGYIYRPFLTGWNMGFLYYDLKILNSHNEDKD